MSRNSFLLWGEVNHERDSLDFRELQFVWKFSEIGELAVVFSFLCQVLNDSIANTFIGQIEFVSIYAVLFFKFLYYFP